MPAHTSGPWEARTFGLYAGNLKLAHFGPISFGNQARSTTQSEANCLLAAAAPDLAGALEKIVDCYGVGWKDPAAFCAAVDDFMTEGNEALKKAGLR